MSLFNSKVTEEQAKKFFLIGTKSTAELTSLSSIGELSRKGICEVAIFNAHLILDQIGSIPNYEDIMEDYLVLLIYMIKRECPEKTTEAVIELINQRIKFYTDAIEDLFYNKNHILMWVYSTFYLCPLENEHKTCLDSMKLIVFELGLSEMIKRTKVSVELEINKMY